MTEHLCWECLQLPHNILGSGLEHNRLSTWRDIGRTGVSLTEKKVFWLTVGLMVWSLGTSASTIIAGRPIVLIIMRRQQPSTHNAKGPSAQAAATACSFLD